MSDRPPPPALRRKGLQRIETNREPGQELDLDMKLFVTLFGDELLEAWEAKTRPQDEAPAAPDTP